MIRHICSEQNIFLNPRKYKIKALRRSVMENKEMPIRFGTDLAMNSTAMEKFVSFSQNEKQNIIILISD